MCLCECVYVYLCVCVWAFRCQDRFFWSRSWISASLMQSQLPQRRCFLTDGCPLLLLTLWVWMLVGGFNAFEAAQQLQLKHLLPQIELAYVKLLHLRAPFLYCWFDRESDFRSDQPVVCVAVGARALLWCVVPHLCPFVAPRCSPIDASRSS